MPPLRRADILIVWVFLCIFAPAFADVTVIGLGVYMLNVGSVKLTEAMYYSDFLLYAFESATTYPDIESASADVLKEDGLTCSDSFMNTATPFQGSDEYFSFINMDRLRGIKRITDANGVQQHIRVMGNQYFETSLHNWPFDSQKLDIIIETTQGRSNGAVQTIFCVSEQYNGLSPHMRFPGIAGRKLRLGFQTELMQVCWPPFMTPDMASCGESLELEEAGYGAEVSESCQCLNGQSQSSRFVFSTTYHRPFMESLVKTCLPPYFILLVSVGSFLFPPQDYATRISVCAAGLTGAVLFHVTLAGQTPPNSQLTRGDTLMFSIYFCNLLAWFASLVIMQMFISGKVALANHWNWRFKQIGTSTSVVCGVLGIVVSSNRWYLPEVVMLAIFAGLSLMTHGEWIQNAVKRMVRGMHDVDAHGKPASEISASHTLSSAHDRQLLEHDSRYDHDVNGRKEETEYSVNRSGSNSEEVVAIEMSERKGGDGDEEAAWEGMVPHKRAPGKHHQ